MQEEYLTHSLDVPLDVINFQYLAANELDDNADESKSENRASLSWHLTTFEKQSIESAILNPQNTEALNKLKTLIRPRNHNLATIP
jgi:hypothetical protein